MAGAVGTHLIAQVGFIVRDVEASKKKWAEFLGVDVPETQPIGDYAITVANDCPVNEIYLDCDLMNAYNGTTNLNNYVSGTFPELVPGANAITGNFEIQPRWWTI
jgi:hypothetical protein